MADAMIYAVSGGAASAISLISFYPLESIRLFMHSAIADDCTKRRLRKKQSRVDPAYAAKQILALEGWGGLYRGLGPALACICSSQFVYFFVYGGMKSFSSEGPLSICSTVSVATLAGLISTLLTTPVWCVGMKMKFDTVGRYTSMADCFGKTVKNQGMHSLYEGLVPSLWMIAGPVVQQVAYNQLKHAAGALCSIVGREAGSFELLLVGATAKLLATLATYPMQVTQNVIFSQNREAEKQLPMQNHRGATHMTDFAVAAAGQAIISGAGNSRKLASKSSDQPQLRCKLTTLSCLCSIFRESGLYGLYRGLSVKLGQTVLNGALMFIVHERLLVFCVRLLA